MREIKFRAWDKEKKIMILDLNGWSKGYSKKYELMQFTGLKDKNGKEIYEGDIIKYLPDPMPLRIVEWYEYGYTCKYTKPIKGILGKGFFEINSGTLSFLESCEVIGNIYENKDLIK